MAGSVNWPISYVQGQPITGRLEAPITPVATTIVPSISGVYSTDSYGGIFQFPSPTTIGTYGGRVEFASTQDLSTHLFFGCQMSQNGFPFNPASGGQAPAGLVDARANGGMSLVIFDALGNWAEYYFWGNEYISGQIEDGGWAQFRFPGGAGALQLTIDRDRDPDNFSGTLDWSQIDGYEFIMRTAVSYGGTPQVGVGSLIVFDEPVLTGGTLPSPATFQDFTDFFQTDNSGYNFREVFRNSGGIFNGGVGEVFEPRFSYKVGDGSTQTIFRDVGSTLAEYPKAEDANATQGCLFLDGNNRGFTINSSATCDIQLENTVLSATDSPEGESFVDVQGSAAGNVSFNSCQFYRKTYVNQTHATISASVFDTAYEVEIETVSTLTDSIIRNSPATSKGLYVELEPAGTYSTNTNLRSSNVGDDITILPAANGTFDFPNISVEAGHTLRLRNDSPTFDIDVGIPVGIPFTTSTAGGAINVTTPPIVITLSAPNLIDDTNVLLINNTQATELDASTVSGGTGYTINLTLGIEYALSDELILLAGYQQGGLAKEIFRFSALAGTENIQNIDFQRDWENPNVLAIDGSTVTECTTDYIEIQVEVDDADNSTEKSRIAAFIVDAVQTFDGLRNWVSVDGIPVIDYPSSTSAVVDTDVALVEIINVKPNSTLEIKDAFEFYWKDGIDRVSALSGQDSNYEWIAPARVLLQETGTSGLTPAESAKLMATAEQSTLLDTQGAGFDTNEDSLVEIRANQGGGGGDATEANQLLILANQATFMPEITNIDANTQQLLIDVDAVPTAIENADALLGRDIQGGSSGARTVTEALRANRNRVDMVNGIVYQEDDTTPSHTYSVLRADLEAVAEVDPS